MAKNLTFNKYCYKFGKNYTTIKSMIMKKYLLFVLAIFITLGASAQMGKVNSALNYIDQGLLDKAKLFMKHLWRTPMRHTKKQWLLIPKEILKSNSASTVHT